MKLVVTGIWVVLITREVGASCPLGVFWGEEVQEEQQIESALGAWGFN